MKKSDLLLSVICFLLFLTSVAQEIPPITNYAPQTYNAENQNWGISQSKDNLIYVANSSGLLEFNGAKWQLYPSPNNSIIRSVNVIGDRIYTGCWSDFGYWIKNDYGQLGYFSLSINNDEISLEDQDFWNIIEFEDWVLFQSLSSIYLYHTKTETFDVFPSKTKLSKIFKVDGSVYFQKMNDGIYKFENGAPVLVSDDLIFKKNEIINIFSVDEKILCVTREKGLYFLNKKGVSKWKIQADTKISSISVYSSILLKDGSIVLGTISDGIVQLDKYGKVIMEIDQSHGLNNNTVLSMFEDREQNLWLGLDIGVSAINNDVPYNVFVDKNGELGAVYASAVYDGKLYLGTNQGLFYKSEVENEAYKFVEGTEGQVWDLKLIDDTLFCGHNNGTYIVTGNSIDLISDIKGTWGIRSFKMNKNLLLQGYFEGLSILHKNNGKWKFRNRIDGFSHSSRFFEFGENDEIFVNHDGKRLVKLTLNEEFTAVVEKEDVLSVPVGFKSSLVKYNGVLFFTSKEGVFKYNSVLGTFKKDSLLSFNLFGKDKYVSGKLIHVSGDNTLWGFSEKNIVRLSQGKMNDELRPINISLTSTSRNYLPTYENVTFLSDAKYLLGESRGYMILDLDKQKNKEYEIKLNSIERSVLNKNKIRLALKNKANLNYEENNLLFEYSVTEFEKYKEVNYQYQLLGIYNDWSEWTDTPEVSFENLPFGKYTFKVKGRVGGVESINIESYEFVIGRPWFLSNMMLFSYAAFILMFSVFMNRVYSRYYSKRQKKAIERTERILRLDNLENERELMKFRNDNLRRDIEGKNRELGASTMNLIKKNEFLNSIKKELKSIADTPNLKKVINIIDKNLNNTDDWKLFETAFNNADKDFLNKVKIMHPELTPNDLKLCAYLRLNLSSKEIAPLLNISFRSVEIKRYRLRKKMDLEHEINLSQYILNI